MSKANIICTTTICLSVLLLDKCIEESINNREKVMLVSEKLQRQLFIGKCYNQVIHSSAHARLYSFSQHRLIWFGLGS